MYNEDESELQRTLRGLIHNYNTMRMDPKTKFTKDDFTIFVIVDGYDHIPESFKSLAREKHFLDEEVLVGRGFMTKDKHGKYKMKDMNDIIDASVPSDDMQQNLLHIFQVTAWDFGLEESYLNQRRINFFFAIK